MNPLNLIPTGWLWPAAGIAGLSLVAGLGVQTLRLSIAEREFAELQGMHAQELQQAEQAARQIEHAAAMAVKEANDAKDKELARVRAAAAGARDELGRLRNALAASGPTPDTEDAAAIVGSDDAARARAVVGACAESLATMAETADACESRVIGLQGYIRAIQPQP